MKARAIITNMLNAVVLTVVLLCQSCCKCGQNSNPVPPEKTVLVYMDTYALSNYFWDNLDQMFYQMSPELSDYANLLVFVDDIGQDAHLLHLHDYQCDTVRTWYGGLDSSSSEVLSMVIDYSVSEFPANEYGLVVWSHGTGWVPDITSKRSPSRDGLGSVQNDSIVIPFTVTRAILPQHNSWMNLEDFVEAIPYGLFDFILFDACHMGGIEVAYELKNRANWLIASAIEIMGAGFPYRKIISDLLHGDYQKVCRTFFEYYDAQTGSSRTAGIALTDLRKLDYVCDAFRDIVNNATVDINSKEFRNGLQRLDRNSIFGQAMLFDLGSVAEHLCPSDPQLIANFNSALNECMPYRANTKYVLYGDTDCLTIDTYCGFNCFVPFAYHDNTYNIYFRDCGWNRAVHFYR